MKTIFVDWTNSYKDRKEENILDIVVSYIYNVPKHDISTCIKYIHCIFLLIMFSING